MGALQAVVVVACLFYEQAYRGDWMKTWRRCQNYLPGKCPTSDSAVEGKAGGGGGGFTGSPEFSVFMIKYVMMLIVGITSGFWIWSRKTLASWKHFFLVVLCRRRDGPVAGV